MNGLERTIQQLQQSMSSLKLKHTEELTELRQRMRKELETERERLLNQIRQQTKLKEEVSAKVTRTTSLVSLIVFRAKGYLTIASINLPYQLAIMHSKICAGVQLGGTGQERVSS